MQCINSAHHRANSPISKIERRPTTDVHTRHAIDTETRAALENTEAAAARYLGSDLLTDWEREFLGSIAQRPAHWRLTERQTATLQSITTAYAKWGRHVR